MILAPTRRGFTLVELLVVTGLLLILMTLAVAIVPKTQERQKVSQAASQLQGWLLSAKQWAMRDQAPRGIRLTNAVQYAYNTNTASWQLTYLPVTQLVYIEQPDDFFAGTPGATFTITSNVNAGLTAAQFQGGVLIAPSAPPAPAVDFSGGAGWPQSAQWPIHTRDLVDIDGGHIYPILGFQQQTSTPAAPVAIITGPSSNAAPADPKLPSPIDAGRIRIIRRPRPKLGEPVLQLATNVIVDLTVNNYPSLVNQYWTSLPSPFPPPLSSTPTTTPFLSNVDILFAPSGEVISAGMPGGDIKLWLRDAAEDAVAPQATIAGQQYTVQFGGPQFIVTVTGRTGMISVQPVDVSVTTLPGIQVPVYTNPYSFTQDGLNSGI